MKKSGKSNELQDLELLKAVAQVWHAHTGDANYSMEFGARRALRLPLCRPSRFKLEAEAAATAAAASTASAAAVPSWDFRGSLWDSYEIATIAKQLEACNLALDQPLQFPPASARSNRQGKRRRESKKSLRSFFYKAQTRRFGNSAIPYEE